MGSSRREPGRPCKICRGDARFLCTTRNAFGGLTELKHYRCVECGLVFVGSPITLKRVSRAYRELDASGMSHQTAAENQLKFGAAIRAVRETVAPDAAILDVGGGQGDFVRILRNAGYRNVAIHEIPGKDLRSLRSDGIQAFQDLDYRSLLPETYDFVSLLDVAEHALYPAALLRACHRVLRPRGTLYMQVPTVTRVDRMMHSTRRLSMTSKIGQRWQEGRTSIFHLQIFTAKSLTIALRKAGFTQFTIDQRNQLAFLPSHYVRSYLCEKQGLPLMLGRALVPLVLPFLATSYFNANRGFVSATKAAPMQLAERSGIAAG